MPIVARRQDAGAQRRAHQNEHAAETPRGKLLGEHGAHGMAEDDRLRRKRAQGCGELGAILGEADADKLLVGSVLFPAMPDQVGRVHRPALALEHFPEFVEAPVAGRRAVQHHDVLAHALFARCEIAPGRAACDTR